ncbi:tetratricopeptide repeat protein [bacterium]|nr:tetratricopeptide repeat protein [bacterium]
MMPETMFDRRSEAEEHYRRGLELKRQGYLLEAELEFKQSLEADPAYFDPLLEILIEQEEHGAAEDIRSDQLLRRADQKYQLGMALMKNNRAEKAVRHFEAACNLESDNAKYFCGLGEALAKTGQMREAREKLRIAANTTGGSNSEKYRARAHYLMGKWHLEEGHKTRARRRLMMAYILDPKSEKTAKLMKKAGISSLQKIFLLPKLKKGQNI